MASPTAALASASAHWKPGIEAPLPTDGKPFVANINAVSCPSAGDCSAVGYYTNTASPQEEIAMMLSETSGHWPAHATAVKLPANADPASASDQFAPLDSVSCASVGNCSAVGSYYTSGNQRGMLVSEKAGVWKPAVEASLPTVPATGIGVLNLTSVSCPSAGNCSAVGYYRDASGNNVGLLLNQLAGVWHKGVAALLPAGAVTTNQGVQLLSVSCASAGNCTAVGYYSGPSSSSLGLIVREVAGKWQKGTKALLPAKAATTNQDAELYSVSCPSVGNCSAVGYYLDDSMNYQGLLLSETSGKWRRGVKALLPSGAATASTAQDATLYSVSCPSAGSCSAAGSYSTLSGTTQGLLVDEVAGTWRRATRARLPSGADPKPQNVSLGSVSCASPGNCAAVGNYNDQSSDQQGLMLSETSGKWQTGIEAGLPANRASSPSVFLNDSEPGGPSVSCGAEASCTAVGTYMLNTSSDNAGLLLTTSPAHPTLSVTGPQEDKVGHLIPSSSVAAKLAAGLAPAGTIAFRVFGPQTSPPTRCASGGRTVGSAKVSGNGTYHPAAGFTPAKAGDYWWYAVYGGDASDLPAASRCGATMAKTVVK